MSGELIGDVTVTTHVGRDLLQSAGLFKHDRLVVWEYVSNGLQYVDSGTNPLVRVKLDKKHRKIVIRDNGRGMDLEGLKNYFVMHGENLDRKAGRAGRGRFGTGKSAAFGIADTLRITTVCGGKRSKVELTREQIESVQNGQAIPLKNPRARSLNGRAERDGHRDRGREAPPFRSAGHRQIHRAPSIQVAWRGDRIREQP